MSDQQPNDELLVTLTADIVAAHVSKNSVAVGEVASLIANVHTALNNLNKPAEVVEEKPKGAVSIRASIKPDHLISMIDGKPYKMLRRHLTQNGYTPESYREAFGLPKDYPMVAKAYTEQRSELAKKIGLGRKLAEKVTPASPAPKTRRKKPAEAAPSE